MYCQNVMSNCTVLSHLIYSIFALELLPNNAMFRHEVFIRQLFVWVGEAIVNREWPVYIATEYNNTNIYYKILELFLFSF